MDWDMQDSNLKQQQTIDQVNLLNDSMFLMKKAAIERVQGVQIVQVAQVFQVVQGVQDKILEDIKQKCSICLEKFSISAIMDHFQQCKLAYEANIPQEFQMFQCESCHGDFTKLELVIHENQCPEKILQCTFCLQKFTRIELFLHQDHCTERKKKLQKKPKTFSFEKNQYYFVNNVCIWCGGMLDELFMDLHKKGCQQKYKILTQIQESDLSEDQRGILFELKRISAIKHFENQNKVQKYLAAQNYTKEDWQLMSDYIEFKAPLIIHIKLPKIIKNLNADFQYKSVFETKKSQGTNYRESRGIWQDHLFQGLYKQSKNQQRIKYGVMNYTNDLFGVSLCEKYGNDIMILNQNVRKRVTLCHTRRYGPGQIVGMLKYHNHVLARFGPEELRALYLAAKGYEIESSQLKFFKEIHIHGPIYMFRDVECIVASESQINKCKADVEIFEKRFGVKIFTHEEYRSRQKSKKQ